MSSPIPQNRMPASTQSSRARRKLALAGLALLALAGYAVWWMWPPATPDRNGGVDTASQAAAAKEHLQAWQQALDHGDWQEANRQEDRLVALGDAAVPGLVGIFTASDVSAPATVRRQRVAVTLGRINSSASVGALLGLWPASPQTEVRGQVLLALAKSGAAYESQVGAVLDTVLSNNNEPDDIRSSAALLIAKRGNTAAIHRLCELALHPAAESGAASGWAISALGFVPATAGLDPFQCLGRILDVDVDPGRRVLAAEALGARGEADATALLITALRSDTTPAVRIAAAEALATRPPTPEGEMALTERLRTDRDPGVRSVAVRALGRKGATTHLALLQETLAAEKNLTVQLMIVTAIEAIGGPPAVEALQRLAATDSTVSIPVRGAAATSLQHLRDAASPHGKPRPLEPQGGTGDGF